MMDKRKIFKTFEFTKNLTWISLSHNAKFEKSLWYTKYLYCTTNYIIEIVNISYIILLLFLEFLFSIDDLHYQSLLTEAQRSEQCQSADMTERIGAAVLRDVCAHEEETEALLISLKAIAPSNQLETVQYRLVYMILENLGLCMMHHHFFYIYKQIFLLVIQYHTFTCIFQT